MAIITKPNVTPCTVVVTLVKPHRGQAPGLAKIVAPHPTHLLVSMTSPITAQDQALPIVVSRINLATSHLSDAREAMRQSSVAAQAVLGV